MDKNLLKRLYNLKDIVYYKTNGEINFKKQIIKMKQITMK